MWWFSPHILWPTQQPHVIHSRNYKKVIRNCSHSQHQVLVLAAFWRNFPGSNLESPAECWCYNRKGTDKWEMKPGQLLNRVSGLFMTRHMSEKKFQSHLLAKCKISRMATSVQSKKGEILRAGGWNMWDIRTFPSLRLHLPDEWCKFLGINEAQWQHADGSCRSS